MLAVRHRVDAPRRCTTPGSARCRPTRAARRCTRARRGSSALFAAARNASLIASLSASSLQHGDEVGDRTGRRRHAQRHAVELALEVGQHETDRLGGAGRARDDRQRGGAHAAQVGLARAGRGRLVLELLVARVRVHGGDEALLDAERCRAAPWRAARGSSSCTTRSRSRCASRRRTSSSFTPMQIVTSASPDGRGDDDALGAALQVARRPSRAT